MWFFYQGAVPQIIEKTTDDFFSRIISLLRKTADIFFDGLADIPCITCPHKPEGAMSVMVRDEYMSCFKLKYGVEEIFNYSTTAGESKCVSTGRH